MDMSSPLRSTKGVTSSPTNGAPCASAVGYGGSGPRDERDLSAPALELGLVVLSRAAFDARAWALLGLGQVRLN